MSRREGSRSNTFKFTSNVHVLVHTWEIAHINISTYENARIYVDVCYVVGICKVRNVPAKCTYMQLHTLHCRL